MTPSLCPKFGATIYWVKAAFSKALVAINAIPKGSSPSGEAGWQAHKPGCGGQR